MFITDSPTNDANEYIRLMELDPTEQLQHCDCIGHRECPLFDSVDNMVIDKDNNNFIHKSCVSDYLENAKQFMFIEDYKLLETKLNNQL